MRLFSPNAKKYKTLSTKEPIKIRPYPLNTMDKRAIK